jgi:hypothetical protein
LLYRSGGIAPMSGVGLDTISGKSTAIVYLGGDCLIDEIDLKWNEIINTFNIKMKELMIK